MQTPTPSSVAIVTGSGRRRLGWHIADALGERGCAVVLHYNTSATDAEEAAADFRKQGRRTLCIGADLSDEQQVARLVQQTLDAFGRIDVLVCCAAIWQSRRLEEVTAADVRRHFEANTLSTFLCCQQVGLVMAGQETGGSIVTFGDWAVRRPYPNYAAYFPSKGAIPTITRNMAVKLALRNPRVRVNCVEPGPVLFPPDMPQAERQQAIDATLVKREGRPANVVQAVLHFIDNDFVTGACLPVDGGRAMYAGDDLLS
jgi:pteridine reductase